MKLPNLSRRNFLKASTVAGLGASLGSATGCATNGEKVSATPNLSRFRPLVSGGKSVHDLTTKPLGIT